jgi:lysophospholipase L1-like esterase
MTPSKLSPCKTLYFGDSITIGEGLLGPSEERWTALVAKAQGRAEVNEGKGGRPASALDDFHAVFSVHRKDIEIDRLVLALGGNDSRDDAPNIAEQVARNVGEMIDWSRRETPSWEVIICGPYNVNREYLQRKDISDLRERNLRAIDGSLRALAQSKKCVFIPFLNVLPPESLIGDGVHPAASGHSALAATFLAAIPS